MLNKMFLVEKIKTKNYKNNFKSLNLQEKYII